MKKKHHPKSKFLLLAFFIAVMTLGANEYLLILERLVKIICTSCIGLGG